RFAVQIVREHLAHVAVGKRIARRCNIPRPHALAELPPQRFTVALVHNLCRTRFKAPQNLLRLLALRYIHAMLIRAQRYIAEFAASAVKVNRQRQSTAPMRVILMGHEAEIALPIDYFSAGILLTAAYAMAVLGQHYIRARVDKRPAGTAQPRRRIFAL